MRRITLLTLLVSMGLSACQPESVAPFPATPLPSASPSLNHVESATASALPGSIPSVSPSPRPTPEPTPEVGPRAVYYLKKESSESSKHRLYQADLETQQTHELDTLDFKDCSHSGLTAISPIRNFVVVYCDGTVYIYNTVSRQRIYATPEVLEPLAYGEPVKWPHESPAPEPPDPNEPSAYPTPAVYEPEPSITPIPQATLPPPLEDISFRLQQTHSLQKPLSESFVTFLPESKGTWAVFARYPEGRKFFAPVTHFKVKLEDLSVEKISAKDLKMWWSPNQQTVLKQNADNTLYVMDAQGQNKREVYRGEVDKIHWRDDEMAFLCSQENDKTKLVTFDLKSQQTHQFFFPKSLFHHERYEYKLCPDLMDVSSDGKQVAIQRREVSIDGPDVRDLYHLNAETSEIRHLARSYWWDCWARFLPDNRLFFVNGNDVKLDIVFASRKDTVTVRENLGQYLNNIEPGFQTRYVHKFNLLETLESEPISVYETSKYASYNPHLSNDAQWVFSNGSKFYAMNKETLALSLVPVPYRADIFSPYTTAYSSDGNYAFLDEDVRYVSLNLVTGERFILFENSDLMKSFLAY